MSEDDTHYAEIHRYLLGEMSADEQKAFALRIAQNPDLAEAVQLEQELQALLRYERRAQLKQILRDLPTDDIQAAPEAPPVVPPAAPNPKPSSGGIRPPFLKTWIPWSGIAAVLIACVFLYRSFSATSSIDNGELYSHYMEEPYNPKALREGDTKVDKAYEAFKQFNWKEAFILLADTLPYQEQILMHGISAMQMDPPDLVAARADFDLLLGLTTDGKLEFDARWYMALLNLRENKLEPCKAELRIIILRNGKHRTEADKLLKELE